MTELRNKYAIKLNELGITDHTTDNLFNELYQILRMPPFGTEYTFRLTMWQNSYSFQLSKDEQVVYEGSTANQSNAVARVIIYLIAAKNGLK